MARNRGRNFRRKPNSDGDDSKRKEQLQNTPVAQFPAPAPDGDKEAATPLFADKMTVSLARVERAIMRNALNYYEGTLVKLIKKNRELGLPVDDLNKTIAIIKGGDGLGTGMYQRLTEQMTIADEAQLRLDDEQRAQQAEAVACRDILLKLDDMPVGKFDEQLLNYVRSWPSDARQAAIDYATTVNALPEGEKYTGEVPKWVRMAIDRAIEWTMSDEDVAKWHAHGPFRASWWEDGAKKTWWYAALPPATIQDESQKTDEAIAKQETPDPSLADAVAEHGLFETEPEAQRCAARLNRMRQLEQDLKSPPPPATE